MPRGPSKPLPTAFAFVATICAFGLLGCNEAKPPSVPVNGRWPFTAVRSGDMEAFEWVIENHPEQAIHIRLGGANGSTLLHAAAHHDRPRMAQLLIERGADIEARYLGNTPLHFAARYGAAETAGVLLKAGADHEAQAFDSLEQVPDDTALTLAAKFGHGDVVRVLLKHGAKPVYELAESKRLPLHWATYWPFFVRNDPDAEKRIAENPDNAEAIDLLVSATGDINVRDSGGSTPLHLAVSSGSPAVVRYLLDNYPEIDVRAENDRGMTPLEIAEDDSPTLNTLTDRSKSARLLRAHLKAAEQGASDGSHASEQL